MVAPAASVIVPAVPLRTAARIISHDGVIAYPTEGVYGLGCRPESASAVARILHMKQRDPSMGLLLVAGDRQQLEPWVDEAALSKVPASSLEHPTTWIVRATPNLPYWIGGAHDGVAVRITAHPTVVALCAAAKSALISTSANRSGRPPARNTYVLRRRFGDLVDFIVPGALGPARGPSEIRRLETGTVIRPTTP